MKTKIERCGVLLRIANGRADEHTYDERSIGMVAARAEAQLDALGLTKKQRAGAVVHCVSGGEVPNAYKYSRALTRATLTRTAGGWWLTEAKKINAWAGFEALYLTPEQDAAAIAHLRKGYRCS